jgi:hypothetical protein
MLSTRELTSSDHLQTTVGERKKEWKKERGGGIEDAVTRERREIYGVMEEEQTMEHEEENRDEERRIGDESEERTLEEGEDQNELHKVKTKRSVRDEPKEDMDE